MASQGHGQDALGIVMPHLHRTQQDARPVVVMTCGIAGAGKSTLSKAIINNLPTFTRLSVDTINREVHGLYKIDYPAEKYEEYLDISQGIVKERLHRLLTEGKRDIVLDLSFWNKPYRDEYRALIERDGGRAVLVFLDGDRELLWRRVEGRRHKRDALSVSDEGRDGDSAFDIDAETFNMYCSGFERPEGEGEIAIKVV